MGVEILDNGTRVLTAPGATFGTDALLLALSLIHISEPTRP